MHLASKTLLGFLLQLTASAARAEPSSGGPSWIVPSTCPSLEVVEQRAKTLLARPDFTLAAANL